jgi:periplasmic copper chaperone A
VSRSVRLSRRVLAPTALAVAAAASLVLSGCASGQVSQTADQVAGIDGANGGIGDLTVLNARLAPTEPEGYQEGADARLLLWVSNDSPTNADTLTAVTSPSADEIVIRGDATIPAQYLADFSGASGTRVTVNGFTGAVPYGQSIPMTFSFESAGSITLNVPIELPGERSTDRPTIEILPPHPTPLWEEGHGEGEDAAAAEEAGDG